MKQKQFGYSLILISLLLQAFIMGSSLAQSSQSTMYIMGGVYPGAPSYTVWVDGSTYYAKDSNGQIDYSGTNASQVVNDATLSSDGTFFLKSGTFSLNAPILIDSEDTLLGEGIGSTILFLADGANCEVIKNRNQDATGDEFIFVRQLEIDGNNAGQTFGVGYYGTGIKFANVDYSVIEDVYIHDCWNAGIYWFSGGVANVRNSWNLISHVRIDTTSVTAVGSALGCATLGKWDDSRIEYSLFENSAEYGGLTLDEGMRDVIDSCVFRYNVRCGLILEGTNSTTKNALHRVVNCVVYNSTGASGHGLSAIEDLLGISFIGNRIFNNDRHGIRLEGCDNSTIQNNHIYNNNQGGTGGDGIVLVDSATACQFNIISNNICGDEQVTATQGYGIREFQNADFNIITGNICTGNDVMGIRQLGTNTHVNLCWNATTWIP